MPLDSFLELFEAHQERPFFTQLYATFLLEGSPRTHLSALNLSAFLTSASKLTRSSDRTIMQSIYASVNGGEERWLSTSKVEDFFRIAFKLHCLSVLKNPEKAGLETEIRFDEALYSQPLEAVLYPAGSGTSPPQEETTKLSFDDFYNWMSQSVPLLYQPYGAYFHSRFCLGLPIPPGLRFQVPTLRQESIVANSLDSLFGLGLASPMLQGAWERLYSSGTDGLSFNRLCHGILGYRGPTVLLLKDMGDHVFGFYTAEAWRGSNSFYGSSECFLFSLEPKFRIIRPNVTSSRHFMYLNTKGYALPHGLGVGGELNAFRLFIPESLGNCESRSADTSFEPGSLSSKGNFELSAIEMWGVGGVEKIQESLEGLQQSRNLASDNIQRARKVNKAAFLGQFDQEHLLGKNFAHRGQVQGRMDGS